MSALDPSEAQVEEAARRIHDPRVSFGVGTAGNLPARSFDAVVSGLVLNFVPDPDAAVSAMGRAAPGGIVAAYVWDYAEGMQMLRTFWDVACELDPAAADLNEGHRFSFANAEALAELWTGAGLDRRPDDRHHGADRVRGLRRLLVTVPRWPGPGARVRRVADRTRPRGAPRSHWQAGCPPGADGTIALMARAWAVRGRA